MPKLEFKIIYQGVMPTKAEIREFIGKRKMFRTLEPMQSNSDGDETGFAELTKIPAGHDDATAVTSELPNGRHMPVIDIDMPCMLVPSSQPGHFHLYIERELEWPKYVALLEAMEAAGIIGPGYLLYTKRRGYSTARYPGVTKSNEWQRIEEGMTATERAARDAADEERTAALSAIYDELGADLF